jgi:hypothetical protein
MCDLFYVDLVARQAEVVDQGAAEVDSEHELLHGEPQIKKPLAHRAAGGEPGASRAGRQSVNRLTDLAHATKIDRIGDAMAGQGRDLDFVVA